MQYGVPLDNRADFTKTDWEMWVAAMEDETVVCSVLATSFDNSILCTYTYIV